MKKIVYLVFLIPIFSFGQASESDKGIHFEHSTFSLLVEKAKKENKAIMIDAYATWCGPCKWMAKNIFPNDTVAAYFNANFINATIDMEKGEGIDLAKKYEVKCYPTFLFIDRNGRLLHRKSGSMDTKEFVSLGLNAMNPSTQFATYKGKYDSGNITADEMAEYILMRGRTCLSAKEEMVKYFSTQSEADLLKPRNWDIFRENAKSMNVYSREFNYLVDHSQEYEKLYPLRTPQDGTVNEVIKYSYSSALRNYIRDKNTEGYKKLKEEIRKKNFSFSEEMTEESDMSLYKSTKEWNNYAQAAIKYTDKYKKEDPNYLNNVAWDFCENINDKALLAKAEEWIKHSVDLQPGYFNYDTYAAVLYKSDKKTAAQAAAEKAIELAKKEGEDYKETEALLEKIKAMK